MQIRSKRKKKKNHVLWKPLRLVFIEIKTKFTVSEIQVRLGAEHKESETQTKSENYSLFWLASSEISSATVHLLETLLGWRKKLENSTVRLNRKYFNLGVHSDQ